MVLMAAGCSGPAGMAPVAAPDESAPMVGLYQLRALDPVKISLLGIPEEKELDTVIDERGNISVPYVNEPVQAAGLTTSELERKLQGIYVDGKIYRNITVNVVTMAKTYFVEGEVRKPQEYPLNRKISLLQAIAAASGYTEYANQKMVTVTRNGKILKFNAKEIEKNPELDIPIEAGDRIKVHRSIF
jgi:polysaccharide export outer membrane protein